MSVLGSITSTHVKKLDHPIDEIRLRALENILSKLDREIECDSNAVKKELLGKLFNWFGVEPYLQEEKVLNLIVRLVKSDNGSYLNSYGRIKFQNELRNLRTKLDSKWYDKLDELEKIASDSSDKFTRNIDKITDDNHEVHSNNHNYQTSNDVSELNSFSAVSPLDGTVPFDLTNNCEDSIQNAVLPRRSESSIKWLVMPWQILVQSDTNLLCSIKTSLTGSSEIKEKIKTCQFMTNVMLQDFPAEVFLHRPTIINILLNFLETNKYECNPELQNLSIVILQTFHKMTRALRFRIYYYCDPSIAHKPQKILLRDLEVENYEPNQRNYDYEEYPADTNYPSNIPPRHVTNSPSLTIDTDQDSILQLQQMFIPNYCTKTLINALKLMSIPSESKRPLKVIRYIAELGYELVQLFITSVMPTVWFCNDNIALKIHDNVKTVLELLSEILDHFGQFSVLDYYRVTYIYFLWLSVKLMSNVIPLEVADQVIPKTMKMSICNALMDGPIYLMYKSLHVTLQQYARRFRGTQESDLVKLLDETRLIAKSMKSAVGLMKTFQEQTYSEELKAVYASKLSLLYHKNFKLIRKFFNLAQNKVGYNLNTEEKEITTKMLLGLLAHSDVEVQEATYFECHSLVSAILGNQHNARYSWKNLQFLLESTILTEIICYGAMHENEKIRNMAENILLYLLKGKVELTEPGWLKFLEALIPVIPLLQCLANTSSLLGKSITKMFDPEESSRISLPFVEVLKGNVRFLFSPNSDVKDEALCRLFWLLGREKDSSSKLPRLTTIQSLSISSIFSFDKQITTKRSEGYYQKSTLVSLLEMLQTTNVEPKMKKSALVQISVMMSDVSLHKLFVSKDGLKIILNIFSKALIERDFENYPDSVISIVTILKHLVSSECTVRIELSNRIDVYYNILRSLFLFSNNECMKTDAPQLLALLIYNGYIMRLTERTLNNPYNISLPYLITIGMRLPFTCKAHWKTSVHRKADISILHRNNLSALTFLRQYWAWQWNNGETLLWKKWEDINDPMITETLKLKESDHTCLALTSLHYYSQRQLYQIQNSFTHAGVLCAIDYLTIYLKLCYLIDYDNFKSLTQLSWANTFERFLHVNPNNNEDSDLISNVLNFLHLYLKVINQEDASWVYNAVKNIMRSISVWIQNTEDSGRENVHQSVLKLIRACSMIDTEENEESQNDWIDFVSVTVPNVCNGIGESYDLALLEWVLSTLSYVIGKCKWKNNEKRLMHVGKILVDLILTFHREGRISFMGVTNIRNCMLCLNHVLYQMQNTLSNSLWIKFWYSCETMDETTIRCLSWLPSLWRSRDPLVRASTFQLLASLINGPHTATQLLDGIKLTPEELCHSLLYFIVCREEACIVKEQACLAMSNLVKNSSTAKFQYLDGLTSNAMLAYMKENNVYNEIAAMCANCYMLSTLDTDHIPESSENDGTQSQSLASSRTATDVSVVPKTIYYLYNGTENAEGGHSVGNTVVSGGDDDDDQMEFITTPSFVISLCLLLNNLIAIGENEVIHEMFENSVHLHLVGCFGEIPKNINGDYNLEHYSSVLEMYTSLSNILTNCLIHSTDFASKVVFSPEFLRHLFDLLNKNLYFTDNPTLIYLRNRLSTNILTFLVALSLTDNQHYDAIQIALETCNVEIFIDNLCSMIKNSRNDLGMSAISFLAFLLSLEMQKEYDDIKNTPLKVVLDTKFPTKLSNFWCDELSQNVQIINKDSTVSRRRVDFNKNSQSDAQLTFGAEICRDLMNLYITLNHTKSIKKTKISKDRDVVTVSLSNLLSISNEAKKSAIEENFPIDCLTVLKEIYVKLNSMPIQTYKTQIEQKKVNPLIMEVDSLYKMLMNFMYDSQEPKEIFAKAGLADVVHKLWAYTSINKTVLITSLKLLSTFTSNCLEASQSLPLTTVTPGVGLRKTPNSMSLLHVIVQIVVKEIDMIGSRNCDCKKLQLAFHVLRNAIHNHDCRVVLSKSNLLQFFPKIHPDTTKRSKTLQLIELNCLEFLIDFTFYDEGQLHVSKAVDSLDVLISLARTSNGPIKELSISILRNLAFNTSNRPRLLGSLEFLNLLLTSFKEGSTLEIEIAGATLWSLIGNNQKGKLIARNSGFPNCIQTAISRLKLQLSVPDSDAGDKERNTIEMLEYVLQIMSPQ